MPYRRPDIPAFIGPVRDAAAAAGDAAMADADDFAKGLLATPYPPASSPGQSPAKRTGALQDGVHHEVSTDDDGVRFAQGFDRAKGDPNVPTYLEFGTSKMAPRPFASVSRDESAPKLKAALVEALRQVPEQ